jgi:hypothetical protein
LGATRFTFLFQLLQSAREGREQLDDDRGRNIRHDVKGKDSQTFHRTTGEHVRHAQNALLRLRKGAGKGFDINARDRDKGPETVTDQSDQGENDPRMQIFGLRKRREVQVTGKLLGC